MSFASRLKQAMQQAHISQSELAAMIDKGKSSVSQYLSGKNVPREAVQAEIAEVLNCTVEFLNLKEPEIDIENYTHATVEIAAKKLKVLPQCIREGLKKRTYPFGCATKLKCGRYTYHIDKDLLDKYAKNQR